MQCNFLLNISSLKTNNFYNNLTFNLYAFKKAIIIPKDKLLLCIVSQSTHYSIIALF